MFERVPDMKTSKFTKDEDGALLVFFAICAAAIFLVASLSFDLGRRASTQTEMQSFVDNVALAAAGELNGLPGAIDRSTRAANELIRDSFVFGEKPGDSNDRDLRGENDYEIFFYATLPADDKLPLENALPKTPASDSSARFVRIVANDIEVEWFFANALSLFSDDALPDERVNAEAVAGYTSLACDVAPVFFCLPRDEETGAVEKDWSIEEVAGPNGNDGTAGVGNIGKTIWLRAGASGGGGGFWEPGNFTWLDVRDQVPPEFWSSDGGVNFDTGGPCAKWANSPNSINMYECLFASQAGTACFTNGDLATKPGQSEGNIAAVFNTRFDLYSSSSNNVAGDPTYQPAPSVIKGYVGDEGCFGGGETETDTTMSLPADDCITGAGSSDDCLPYNSAVRFGDGDWSEGRLLYVDTNYSITPGHVGTVVDVDVTATKTIGTVEYAGELMTIGNQVYHKDDPFRPNPVDDGTEAKYYGQTSVDDEGNPTGPRELLYPKPFADQGFVDVPVMKSPSTGPDIMSTRWDYYRSEVAATLHSNPEQAYEYVGGPNALFEYDVGVETSATRKLILDIDDGAGNTLDRLGNSLPICSRQAGGPDNFSKDPRRRTLIAAAIDCEEQQVQGNTTNMRAAYFLEVFLLGPSGDSVDPNSGKKNPKTKKDIFVEVISPTLGIGVDGFEPGLFPNFVQLYH